MGSNLLLVFVIFINNFHILSCNRQLLDKRRKQRPQSGKVDKETSTNTKYKGVGPSYPVDYSTFHPQEYIFFVFRSAFLGAKWAL